MPACQTIAGDPFPSPTPIYFTGILNWSDIPITTPPLAVPSNLVKAKALTAVASVNCLHCSIAFCPVDASKHQQYFVRGAGHYLLHYVFNFGKLVHQAYLIM